MVPRLSPERSSFLSFLLDDVAGTQDMIKIRQDYCRIRDCLSSIPRYAFWLTGAPDSSHYTGSKAEGLDLPGSDDDFMFDINDMFKMTLIQRIQDARDIPISHQNVYLVSTENVPVGFALLRCVKQTVRMNHASHIDQHGIMHLGSNQFMDTYISVIRSIHNRPYYIVARQGPSAEGWTEYQDLSEPGTDCVPSIHCEFWPSCAQEWVKRCRQFGWPTARDISSIVAFGCHLVPVGHPKSPLKLIEWRISFSIAERTLVWSFNRVQMQCYAVMKIILKEFY